MVKIMEFIILRKGKIVIIIKQNVDDDDEKLKI